MRCLCYFIALISYVLFDLIMIPVVYCALAAGGSRAIVYSLPIEKEYPRVGSGVENGVEKNTNQPILRGVNHQQL